MSKKSGKWMKRFTLSLLLDRFYVPNEPTFFEMSTLSVSFSSFQEFKNSLKINNGSCEFTEKLGKKTVYNYLVDPLYNEPYPLILITKVVLRTLCVRVCVRKLEKDDLPPGKTMADQQNIYIYPQKIEFSEKVLILNGGNNVRQFNVYDQNTQRMRLSMTSLKDIEDLVIKESNIYGEISLFVDNIESEIKVSISDEKKLLEAAVSNIRNLISHHKHALYEQERVLMLPKTESNI